MNNDTIGHALAANGLEPFGCLSEAAVHDIRRLYEAAPTTRDTLAVLFAIHMAQSVPGEAWVGFLVETVCAQFIWDERPTGTLTAVDATWMLARFDEKPSLGLLAVLVRLLEDAQRVPSGFSAEVRRRAAIFANRSQVAPTVGQPTSVPYLRLVA